MLSVCSFQRVSGTVSVMYLILFVTIKGVYWGANISNWEIEWHAKSTFFVLSGMLSLSFFIHNIIISIMRNNRYQEHNVIGETSHLKQENIQCSILGKRFEYSIWFGHLHVSVSWCDLLHFISTGKELYWRREYQCTEMQICYFFNFVSEHPQQFRQDWCTSNNSETFVTFPTAYSFSFNFLYASHWHTKQPKPSV